MRRLVVHIGTPKAASTSLQEGLVEARPILAAAGIDYPALGRDGGSHRALALELESGRPGPVAARLSAHLRTTTAEAVVLSAEQFEGSEPGAGVAEAIAALAREAGFRPLAVAVVRPQVDYLNAVYAQHVVRLFTDAPFGRFLDRMIDHRRFDYGRQFEPWSSRQDMDFAAIPLTPPELDGGIVATLLRAAGLEGRVAGPLPAPVANTTPGPAAIEAFRRLAARSGRARLGNRYAEARRELEADMQVADPAAPRFFAPDQNQSVRISKRFAEPNEAIARHWWGRDFEAVFGRPEPRRPNALPPDAHRPDLDAAVDAILARFGRPERWTERAGRWIAGRASR